MSEQTAIQWTDATWNPVTGCTRVSKGCRNCYAERLTAARLNHHPRYEGLALWHPIEREARWTGDVRLHEDLLDQPLHWRKPKMVFVCSMSDLFHPKVPFEFIDTVFATMCLADRHTFQVLTKRPGRMRQYLSAGSGGAGRVADGCLPLPNVWLGTSVEDQAAVNEHVPLLQASPAVVRFLSCEPLLGAIDFLPTAGIHWVICGGETGPGARPMNLDWARSIRDQCQAAGVPFFLKQLNRKGDRELDGRTWDEMPRTAATGARP